MKWKVRFFQTARGSYPVKEFIEKQNFPIQAKINKSIRLLINYGPFLKPPYSKKLQGKLYELRIIGKVSIRIFYTPYNNQYFLLHVIKKKAQKIPKKEIKTALDRMKELI